MRRGDPLSVHDPGPESVRSEARFGPVSARRGSRVVCRKRTFQGLSCPGTAPAGSLGVHDAAAIGVSTRPMPSISVESGRMVR